MPVDKPKPGETQEQFISYCIGEEIKSGREQTQAAAICYSNWDNYKMSMIKDTASKVMAKVAYNEKFEGINLKDAGDPCWEGYEQYGTKELDGREVPNCIPIKE